MWNVKVLDYVARNGNQLVTINGSGLCTIYYGSVLYTKWDPGLFYLISILMHFSIFVGTASASLHTLNLYTILKGHFRYFPGMTHKEPHPLLLLQESLSLTLGPNLLPCYLTRAPPNIIITRLDNLNDRKWMQWNPAKRTLLNSGHSLYNRQFSRSQLYANNT